MSINSNVNQEDAAKSRKPEFDQKQVNDKVRNVVKDKPENVNSLPVKKEPLKGENVNLVDAVHAPRPKLKHENINEDPAPGNALGEETVNQDPPAEKKSLSDEKAPEPDEPAAKSRPVFDNVYPKSAQRKPVVLENVNNAIVRVPVTDLGNVNVPSTANDSNMATVANPGNDRFIDVNGGQ